MSKVLIVDDACFLRVMLKDILEKNNHEVIGEASNGIEAVKLYKQLKPDLVTMDITMPDMEGIEAVKHIKAFDEHAKIIMCSAMGQEAKIIQSIKAGAKDFIVKPFNEDKLIDSVNKMIC